MEKRLAVLSALFLAVVASGCVNNGSSTGGITVSGPDVQPRQIYQGSTVRVSLDVDNNGKIPATVDAGEKGKNIMTDYCPDIFTSTDKGYDIISPYAEGNTVGLKPGSSMMLQWELKETRNVPMYGLGCDIKFQLPFNYSVSTYRQIQVKRTRDSAGTPKLHAQSSEGPLFFATETIGSTSQDGKSTFIAGEDDMEVLLQLQNRGSTRGYMEGVVNVDKDSFSITASGPVEINSCDTGDRIKLFEGKSRVIKCDADIPSKDELDSPSITSEITAKIDYTYVMGLGSKHVEVKTRGG